MNDIRGDELLDPAAENEGETAQALPGPDPVETFGDKNVDGLDQAAIARALIESAPDKATILVIFNSGANANIVGQAGAASFGFASPNVDQQTISAWYRRCVKDNEYDGASIAAVAFLPTSPVRKQRQAAKALAVELGLGPPPLADTFNDSLTSIGAVFETSVSPFTKTEITSSRFDPPERAEVRHHLWVEVLRFEDVLSSWICRQGASGDLNVSMPIGFTVGDLTLRIADAPRELRRIFEEVIDIWAANGRARHALGQALRVAVSNPRAARLLGERLGWWTRSQTPADLKKALNVCRSSWAVDNPELALAVLHEIEPRARSTALFFGVQNAISTMWLGASFLRNTQQGLAMVVAQTLVEWSSSDEKSVFFKRPQQRIAYAIDHELSNPSATPLVLASALEHGELARVVAKLFGTGLHRESTRRDIEATLSNLMARANTLGQDQADAYKAFIRTIQEMGFAVGPELGGSPPGTLSTLLRRFKEWLHNLLRR